MEFMTSPIAHLEETKYTVARTMLDITGSLIGYEGSLKTALVSILDILKKSPYKHNILYGVHTFNAVSGVAEVHGTLPADQIDSGIYTLPYCTGGTPLYDAIQAGVKMITEEGNVLYENDFAVNGILFVVTDGEENHSRSSENELLQAINEIKSSEKLDSMVIVLIGVNDQGGSYLEDLQRSLNIDYCVKVGNLNDAAEIRKLVGVVSSSVIAQSQQIVSNGPTGKSVELKF